MPLLLLFGFGQGLLDEMARTLQAARQRIYTALTSPPLTYQIGSGPILTLPAASVEPRLIWQIAQPPSPLVSFSVSGRAPKSRYLYGERNLTLKVWVTASSTEDEVVEISEAILSRLGFADGQLGAPPAVDLSRPPQGGALGIAMRELVPTRVSDVDYERETSRWYVVQEYAMAAI